MLLIRSYLQGNPGQSELQPVGGLFIYTDKMAAALLFTGTRVNHVTTPRYKTENGRKFHFKNKWTVLTRERFPGEFVRSTGAPITTISINVTRNTTE